MDGTRARLEAVLRGVLPGKAPALHIDQVVERTRLLLGRLGVDPEVWEDRLTVRTVRYYRSKGIVSAPSGEGPNARYGARHVLEAAVARLAGHLHHLSLADAAERIAALDEAGLTGLLGELTESAEDEAPHPLPGAPAARPLPPHPARGEVGAQPEVGVAASVTVRLPHGALLVLPAGHPALARVPAEEVGRAVAGVLEGGATAGAAGIPPE